VLSEHAHHVRPLVDAMSDAIAATDAARRLPHTLLATLVGSGWTPRTTSRTTPVPASPRAA
jgi:hypothetical protein